MIRSLFEDSLFVSEGRGKRIIHVKKELVFFAKGMDNDVQLITGDAKRYIYHSTFRRLLDEMHCIPCFRQVHKSYAIRMDYIAETLPSDYCVRLEERYKNILASFYDEESPGQIIPFGEEFMEAHCNAIERARGIGRQLRFKF